jgi:hypothetical protein
MQSSDERSTQRSAPARTTNSNLRDEAAAEAARYRTPPENAFSAAYLEKARQLEEPPFARQALFAGPWEVEAVPAGDGFLWAVIRTGEPVAEGGRAVAVFLRRPDALVTAAALTALSTPCHLHLNSGRSRSAPGRRRLGFPLHDGTVHLGHLAQPEEDLLPYLHAVRCLVANPDALALALEALGPELPPIVGRSLMRRLRRAGRHPSLA